MALKMKKATPEQAYLKLGFYGNQGSGKTLTALLLAEWLSAKDNERFKTEKRVAYIDTERGTDFYSREVKSRKVHPAGFDFDRAVTRSVYDVRDFMVASKEDPSKHNVIVLDSVTHLWEAAKEAYAGKLTSDGRPPIGAWGSIKRPWKQMVEAGLNGQFHFIFCGREGIVYEKDEESGQDSVTGYKMKAEGEAGYEPHVLVQMYQYRNMKTEDWTIKAYIEKDRSGCLTGKTIPWPNGETFAPLYELLSGEQGTFTDSEETSSRDIKAREDEHEQKLATSIATFEQIRNAVISAGNQTELKAAWELTKGKKKVLGDDHFEALSALVDGRLAEIKEARVSEMKKTSKADLAKEESN